MRESAADLEELQRLIDRSYAGAGRQLLEIHTPERRLRADQVAERLQGVCLLSLATVTGDGLPRSNPVDGIFYRGAFHFGTSPDALRWRHLVARPQVSATHVPSESLAITVHGRAVPVPIDPERGGGFRQLLLDIYTPRYGTEWTEFLDSGPVYARIDAEQMFAFAAT